MKKDNSSNNWYSTYNNRPSSHSDNNKVDGSNGSSRNNGGPDITMVGMFRELRQHAVDSPWQFAAEVATALSIFVVGYLALLLGSMLGLA